MKLCFLKIQVFLLLIISSFSISQYPYQTYQSFDHPSQNVNFNENPQATRTMNLNQIQMPPKISSNSFMTQVLFINDVLICDFLSLVKKLNRINLTK